MSHDIWQRWYDGLSRRGRLHHHVFRRWNEFENWLAERPFTDHDWLYQTDGPLGRIVDVLLGHMADGDRCLHCGKLLEAS